jgi:hypothetical protein
MPSRRAILFLSSFLILLSSCSPASTPPSTAAVVIPTLTQTIDISTPTVPVADTPTSLATAPALPLPQYTLNVTLDYRRKRLNVDEGIVYINNTGETLNELVLAVAPNIWESVFKLGELKVNGAACKDYKLEGQRLTIPLKVGLDPAESINLALTYTLVLPEVYTRLDVTTVRPQFFGYTSRQMNLVNWYPFIVPHAARGWILHDPWYYGEHLVYDPADFEVNIRNAQEGIVPIIAASAVGEPDGEWTRFSLQNARAFAFSASTEFQRSVTNAGNVFIYSYYFPTYKPSGEAAANAAADAIETFTRDFGPYPHSSLTIVMSDFDDGAEFSAFFFLSRDFYRHFDNTRANYLTFISAHETAHQWWFEQVANDQYLEPWLDEALATYSEELFYEKTDLPLIPWWTAHRIDPYAPSGFVDIPLDTAFETDPYHNYVNAVYLRGALFLGDLRTRIGDKAFFEFLQHYLNRFKGKRATADDFFGVLREHTTVDISDLMNEYFQTQH